MCVDTMSADEQQDFEFKVYSCQDPMTSAQVTCHSKLVSIEELYVYNVFNKKIAIVKIIIRIHGIRCILV